MGVWDVVVDEERRRSGMLGAFMGKWKELRPISVPWPAFPRRET